MKHISLRYGIFIFITTFLAACTERVEINLNDGGDPMLVVFGEITNEPAAHAVYLSQSVPYFHNQKTPVVSGAVVTINDGTDTVYLTEDPGEPGTYLTPDDYAGVPGKTYTLEISNVNIEGNSITSYSAETIMKSVAEIRGVEVFYDSMWEEWQVLLYADEPAETEDFYLFKIYKNDVLYTDSLVNYMVTSDEFFNGNNIEGAVVQYFEEDRDEMVEKDDVIILEMYGITEEYYNFVSGALEEINESFPMFSGPPANVKGNISNGAFGFFAVIPVSRGSVVYQGE